MTRRLTLEQAVRDAVEAEKHAAFLYEMLAQNTDDELAKELLTEMAAQENLHATTIEELGETLGAGELPPLPRGDVADVEVASGWEFRHHLTYDEALQYALRAEHNARLYYEGMARRFDPPVSELFENIAATEMRHATVIEQIRRQLSSFQLERSLTL
jgi:rubrerythrin